MESLKRGTYPGCGTSQRLPWSSDISPKACRRAEPSRKRQENAKGSELKGSVCGIHMLVYLLGIFSLVGAGGHSFPGSVSLLGGGQSH